MKKVLFVCLGNICRSPAAEAILKKKIAENKLEVFVDSAGTSGFHDGEAADSRMIESAKKRGIDVTSISRKFKESDFDDFDQIFVMDDSNYTNVMALSQNPNHFQKVKKFTDFATGKYDTFDHVPDPYFGGQKGFDTVLDLLDNCCEEFLKEF